MAKTITISLTSEEEKAILISGSNFEARLSRWVQNELSKILTVARGKLIMKSQMTLGEAELRLNQIEKKI